MKEKMDIYLYVYLQTNRSEFINGSMHVYESEATVPKNIYADAFGKDMIPSSMNADNEGTFPVFYADKPYKVIIRNRHGETVFLEEY